MSRENLSRARRRAWHLANVRAASTPGRRLAAASAWLRAEAHAAGPAAIEQVTQVLLAQAAELNQQAKPAPSTDQGGQI